jgi:hypothetical protein
MYRPKGEVGMGAHSRRKGQRGELAARAPLAALTGQEWKRSDQDTPFGDNGIPDLVPVDGSVPAIHPEVKVGRAPPVLPALFQALESVRGHAVPLALVKRDRGPWVLAVRVEDFWALVEACGGTRP